MGLDSSSLNPSDKFALQKRLANKIQSSSVFLVVKSRFNSAVVDKLYEGCLHTFASFGIPTQKIRTVTVPGAFEIPFAIQNEILSSSSAQNSGQISGQILGVVALGAVIRGETYHFESVCNSVDRGVMDLMLKHNVPIGFGVIMTENEGQAWDRCGGSKGNKGAEATEALLEMVTFANR